MLKYDGYTKVKNGTGRQARYETTNIYKCTECGHEVRVRALGGKKVPKICPQCGK